MHQPKKILIIRFSSLGDLILTSPIYRELRKTYPDAHLTLLTSLGFGDVLDNNPHLDCIIKHPRKESFLELNQLIQNLEAEKFDLIYDAHCSMRSRWIVGRLTDFGIKNNPIIWKISKRTLYRQMLIRFGWNHLKNGLSQREQWLLPLKQQSPRDFDTSTQLFPGKKEQTRVYKLMRQHGLEPGGFIAMGPSASQPLKCWPLSNFRQLTQMLIDSKWQIVLVGGPDEPEAELLEEEFKNEIINCAGQLSPLESAELLRCAKYLVANDTSLVHLAEAMGTPSTAIFGPTVREFGYAPFLSESQLVETKMSLRCRPCSPNGSGLCKNSETLACLDSISPQTIFESLNLDKIN